MMEKLRQTEFIYINFDLSIRHEVDHSISLKFRQNDGWGTDHEIGLTDEEADNLIEQLTAIRKLKDAERR